MSETAEDPKDLETLLEYLKESRGFDFTGYKRSSLSRRIRKRMESLGISEVTEYLDRLQVDPDEFTQLFNFILINVTSFFRDPQIWDFVNDEVVPQILELHGQDDPIRVWVPGCASGEEPYSVAMIFANRLGVEAVRHRVKIYATDVDEEALAQARAASYTSRQVDGIPGQVAADADDRQGQLEDQDRPADRSADQKECAHRALHPVGGCPRPRFQNRFALGSRRLHGGVSAGPGVVKWPLAPRRPPRPAESTTILPISACLLGSCPTEACLVPGRCCRFGGRRRWDAPIGPR